MIKRDAQTDRTRQRNRTDQRIQRTWHPQVRHKVKTRIRELLRRQAFWTWLPVMLLIALSHPARAQVDVIPESEISPGQMQSGSLLLRMKSGYVIATRMNTDIDAQVSGLVARVRVKQTFRNDGPEWVEVVELPAP